MKILIQLSILFGCCIVGNALSAVLPVPVPGSVLAMVLLFILLCAGAVKPRHIAETGDWILNNMAIFFLPPCIAIMEYFDILRSYIVQLLIIVAVSTVVTFAAAAGAGMLALKLQQKLRGSKTEAEA